MFCRLYPVVDIDISYETGHLYKNILSSMLTLMFESSSDILQNPRI